MTAAARLALLLALGSVVARSPAATGVRKVALAKTTVDPNVVRPGFELTAPIPAQAFRAKVGGWTIDCFDLDGDGKLAPEVDGMALDGGPFVVPIPCHLLSPDGQFTVTFDGTREMVLTPEELGPIATLVGEASLLTEVRCRAGVRPAAIDVDRSHDCEKHCDYLMKNGLADGSAGLAIHQEDASKPGYTAEGAVAGGLSNLFPKVESFRDAIEGWYASVWHGELLVRPRLRTIGVALKHGIAMLYCVDGERPSRDFLHPADGAVGIPPAFGVRGETPNPVPGTEYARSCGFPVLIMLADRTEILESAELINPWGRVVRGTLSCPAQPATQRWPTNSGCAVFIPAAPLVSNVIYHARFKLAGRPAPVEWSFKTGRAAK